MDAKAAFAPLDLFLLTVGIQIFPTNGKMKCAKQIISLTLLLCAISNIHVTLLRMKYHEYALSMCVRAIFAFAGSLGHHLFFTLQARDVNQFLETIFQLTLAKYKQRLLKLSKILLTVQLVSLMATWSWHMVEPIKNGSFELIHKSNDTKPTPYYQFAYVEYFCYYGPFVEYQWVATQCIIYLYVVSGWYYAEQSFLYRLKRQPLYTIDHYQEKLKQLNQLNDVKSQISGLFAILPLSWFCLLFAEATGLLVHLKSPEARTSFLVFAYLRDVAFISSLLVLVVKLQRDILRKKMAYLHHDVHPTTTNIQLIAVYLKFEEAMTSNELFHAYLFQLDSTLMIRFFGSLISFTVMFLQFSSQEVNSSPFRVPISASQNTSDVPAVGRV
ncbi:hypothetical protein HDE_06384 [Halotydeus destructor]|nr:hypothetical protein HDE_06384 [Halotydeus destructor]